MHVYHYHPATGELLGRSLADESPLEPGVFLVPAHSTMTAPPVPPPQKAVVFKDGAWIFVQDHRGETWYTPEGIPVVIATPGNPEGLLPEPPPLPSMPPQVPRSVTAFQARKALLDVGLYDTVEALIANPETDRTIKIAYEYATEWKRDSNFVKALAPALHLTEEQVDALFIAASQVT